MFTAAHALKKILAAKVTTTVVFYDEYGDVTEEFTQEQWNKRTTVPHFHVPNNRRISTSAENVVGCEDMDWEDEFLPITKKVAFKTVNLVKVSGILIHPDAVKKSKTLSALVISQQALGYSYTVRITPQGMKIGCQDRTWQEWEEFYTSGYTNSYGGGEVTIALRQVLDNREAIVAKLTGKTPAAKKTVAKKVTKKAPVKKVAAKKAVKKTTKRK